MFYYDSSVPLYPVIHALFCILNENCCFQNIMSEVQQLFPIGYPLNDQK